MQKEKLAAIGLTLIVVGALSAFLLVEYSDEIFDNLKDKEETVDTSFSAKNDYITIKTNSSNIFLNLLSNDKFSELDAVTMVSVSNPTNGVIFQNENIALYTPNPNFIGNDSFTYVIENINKTQTKATVYITIEDRDTPLGEEIELGDCADIDFVAYFANGTIYITSYKDVAIEKGIYDPAMEGQYVPLNLFASIDLAEIAPVGYEAYRIIPINGFMEGAIGLKEGENTTIGPIPPEKGFGVKLQIDDIVNVTADPELGIPDMHTQFIDIIENFDVTLIPEDFQMYVYGQTTTTAYIGKDLSQNIGDVKTLFPSWKNASTATKIDDTHIWWKTVPSEDQLNDFTWMEDTGFGYTITYWANASSAVINEEDDTIVITQNPTIGQKFNDSNAYYSIEYTVVDISDGKINCSYKDLTTGNDTYALFNTIINVSMNSTQNLITEYPEEYISLLFTYYRLIDPNMTYGVGPLVDQTFYFDVHVSNVYKTSYDS